jgi:hypothetical protein
LTPVLENQRIHVGNGNLILALILACCITRLWLVPLTSSFWVDEMGTVFVVHHGAADPTLRAAPQVADSIYYVLPALAEKVAGLSEVSYRFFSLLAMAGALLAIARLASRLIDPRAAWIAVLGCLASRNFDFQAADARPYALGTFILTVALLGLVRWLDYGRWRDGLIFALCASALWWVHLIFWPFYLIFLIYGVYRVLTGTGKATPAQTGTIACITGAACLAPLLRSISLLHAAAAHVVVPPPAPGELVSELGPATVAGVCVLGPLLTRWGLARGRIARDSLVLILAWWLIDPVVLFAFSRASGDSLFVPRYMYLALPGRVLTACGLARMFVPVRLWKPGAAILGIGALVFAAHWTPFRPVHQRSDWRAAARSLRDWSAGEQVPVICPSPFIEARPPVWTPDYPISGFLYSHLSVYPVGGRIYPFPHESPPEAGLFAHQLTAGTLANAPRFAIYGLAGQAGYWRAWFAAQPELKYWDNRVVGLYGDVELVAFVNRK